MSTDDGSTFFPRYLKNISLAIATCPDQNEINILLAKKAGYLARHSLPNDARAIVKDLRKLNQKYDPRLTGWAMLSEGLILHYESLDDQGAKAKFSRALVAGRIAQDLHLSSTAAAWLASAEYSLGEINLATEHLRLAFQISDSENSDARGRAFILLGAILYWCGQTKPARHYFMEARKYAILDGDIAMQNIIFFNIANSAVWDLTLQDCKAPISIDSWRFVALEVASAKNLNAALRIENLPSLIPTMEAELKIVQRNWEDSERIFCETIHKLEEEGQQRTMSKLFAQRAWCRANLGDSEGVRSDISDALMRISECEDLDDLLVMHSRISKAAEIIGELDISARHHGIAQECGTLFSTHQNRTYELVVPILEFLDSETKNPA